MDILDTQIISYSFKDSYEGQIKQQNISSVTAKEFLLMQGSERTKANYYVPMLKSINHHFESGFGFPKLDHPFSKGSTDQIILEFGRDYPALIDFGNLAIAEKINQKAKQVFGASIQFLEKAKRKMLMERFEFLLYQNITCLPLNQSTVELGLNLLHEFTSQYNTKENFKNTVNDVFILATAINSSSTLVTKDSLLNRFASERFHATTKENAGTLLIDFSKDVHSESRKSRESKGYINKGWRVRVQNYQGAW